MLRKQTPGPTPVSTAMTPHPATITFDPVSSLSVAPGLCMRRGIYPAAKVSHCIFGQTWEDVRKLKGIMATGGLVDLSVAYECGCAGCS